MEDRTYKPRAANRFITLESEEFEVQRSLRSCYFGTLQGPSFCSENDCDIGLASNSDEIFDMRYLDGNYVPFSIALITLYVLEEGKLAFQAPDAP